MNLAQYTERILDTVLENSPPQIADHLIAKIVQLYQSVNTDAWEHPTGPPNPTAQFHTSQPTHL